MDDFLLLLKNKPLNATSLATIPGFSYWHIEPNNSVSQLDADVKIDLSIAKSSHRSGNWDASPDVKASIINIFTSQTHSLPDCTPRASYVTCGTIATLSDVEQEVQESAQVGVLTEMLQSVFLANLDFSGIKGHAKEGPNRRRTLSISNSGHSS
ncbi:hypothetical protein DL93DRAFT_2074242 [Clavulina sp. PMI_390]|nr:hypothetical protein DL93DRAFT_2074242 [Clavulina sp. PMI_390]